MLKEFIPTQSINQGINIAFIGVGPIGTLKLSCTIVQSSVPVYCSIILPDMEC